MKNNFVDRSGFFFALVQKVITKQTFSLLLQQNAQSNCYPYQSLDSHLGTLIALIFNEVSF